MAADDQETAEPVELEPDVRRLLTEGTRIGKLASTRKNGDPWVQPLWFILDGNDVKVVLTDRYIEMGVVLATLRVERAFYMPQVVSDPPRQDTT